MTRIKNLLLSAKPTSLTFYKLFEKYYARTLPAMVRQSADTEMRSKNFGIASKAGKALYQELLTVVSFQNDKSVQNKFSNCIARWLQLQSIRDIHPENDIPQLHNFQLNTHAALHERFPVEVSVNKLSNNSFRVNIPSFVPVQSIIAPANTISGELRIMVTGCGLQSGASKKSNAASSVITYNDSRVPSQTIILSFPQTPGNLIVIAVSLTYNLFQQGKVQKCIDPAFMPCAIIKGLYC